ncbi:hypothetical protein GW17_00041510 [Ensete ventricosum]|nr:hypothetical protein GW17_00041510 [Ensete ventricosum]
MLSLCRQWLPLPVGGHPAKGGHPCGRRVMLQACVPAGGCRPCGLRPQRRPPLRAAAPASDVGLPCGLALAVAWPGREENERGRLRL